MDFIIWKTYFNRENIRPYSKIVKTLVVIHTCNNRCDRPLNVISG